MTSLNQLTTTQVVKIYQKEQDPVYLGELYSRHFKKVYNYCLGKVKKRNDAYDITTDTFIKLTTKIIDLKNPELFTNWLFRIARNACIDLLRAKRKNHTIIDVSNIDVEEDIESLHGVMTKEAKLQKLDTILGTLEYKTKTILINKYIKGKSIEDLEKEMGLSKSAIKMRLSRGRKQIAILWA